MKKHFATGIGVFWALLASLPGALGQCSTTTANTCLCQTSGATNCDLFPDIMISWQALQTYASGPSEYSQTSTNTSGSPGTANAGRLRVTGATPNVGHGPLEVRGVNAAGWRKFICGPEIDSIYAPSSNPGFTCPNGFNPKQILFQRVYHKNGNTMTYADTERGTMTYHSGHGHYHIDGWTTMTLRMQQPGVSDPQQWPIIATGGKLGFCLINLFTCSGSSGYCRTSHLYNQGTILTNTSFGANYNLGNTPYSSCGDDAQGIYVGAGDIYSESLDGMWVNMMPGLCNNVAGDNAYWLVAQVDPNNDFLEEDDSNNWTAIPVNLTQQAANNSGGTADIMCSGRLVMAPGETRTLSASPGTAYLWSTGATTRSITVSAAGTYSCTVTCPCGSLSTPALTLSLLAAPAAPVGTGATIFTGTQANISATGGNIHWYDAASGGTDLGTGTNFTTPVLATTTNYWAEDRNTSAGLDAHVGKLDNTGSGAYNSSKQWLLFDASEPFKLVSFKVYANSIGTRHFVLVDKVGNLIAEKFIEIPSGAQTITVNWDVPAGSQYRITAFDDNSEVVRDLYRNDGGVSYPYPIGTVGSITGCTAGSSFYYYLYDWVVHTDAVVAVGPRTMVTATVTNGVQLTTRLKLEGPYVSGTGLMNDDLRLATLLPSTEPYTAMGLVQVAGGGGEALTPSLLTVSGNDAIVDWVRIELRSAVDPTAILATRQCLVQRDGDVVSAAGSPSLTFTVAAGNYYVAVRHRNHLGCMTANALALSNSSVTVDFTLAGTATWGTQARKDISGVQVLWTGNTLFDSQLLYTGASNDRDIILSTIGGVVPTATSAGYNTSDCTMDGVTKYTGSGNDRDPILSNIGGTVPTATRLQQLP